MDLSRRKWWLSSLLGGLLLLAIVSLLFRAGRDGAPRREGIVASPTLGGPSSPATAADRGASLETGGGEEELERSTVEPASPPAHGLEPRADQPPATPRGPSSPADPDDLSRLRGRIVDARDGRPVVGAVVRATLFRADAIPDGELFAVAGTPPLDAVVASTDSRGEFVLAPPLPEDPRCLLHVQIGRRGYAPRVALLRGRDGSDGGWRETLLCDGEEDAAEPWAGNASAVDGIPGEEIPWVVHLRPALLGVVRVVDPGSRPLAHRPIRVWPRRETPRLRSDPTVRRSPDGRLSVESEPRVLFTDSRGEIPWPAGGPPLDAELLAPDAYLVHPDPWTGEERRGRVVLAPGPDAGARVDVLALPTWVSSARLVDRDGLAIAAAEVSLDLEGQPRTRLLTDEEGAVTLPVLPPGPGSPVDRSWRRSGELRVETARYPGVSRGIELPFAGGLLSVPARARPVVGLRLVAEGAPGGDEDPPPGSVRPRGLRFAPDLAVLRIGGDGEIDLAPDGEDLLGGLRVSCRGYVTARVEPPAPGGDLGWTSRRAVSLEVGRPARFRVTGVDAARLRGARLWVAPLSAPGERRDWPVAEDGRVAVRGLPPKPLLAGVEGPRLRPSSRPVDIPAPGARSPGEDGEDGEDRAGVPEVELAARAGSLEPVQIEGRVVDLDPWLATRCEVVERYRIAGETSWRDRPAYRLAPDGRFGGMRWLEPVEAVHVAVVGPDGLGADAERVRGTERGRTRQPVRFVVGPLRLALLPVATVAFEVDGLGRVEAPFRVSVRGEDGIESAARLAIVAEKLRVEGLRPGRYELRWDEADGTEGVFAFDVGWSEAGALDLVATRRPRAEERVRIAVVDADGRPLSGARLSDAEPSAEGLPLAAPAPVAPEAGTLWVPIRPGADCAFTVVAEGHLPARVALPAGAAVPREVVLHRPVRARGRAVDADGLGVDGELLVSWEAVESEDDRPQERHGEPRRVLLRAGWFEVDGLPPLRRRFSFALEGTDIAISRILHLPRVDRREPHDLGVIRLEPTWSIAGRVVLPDGGPAGGATAALLPYDRAWRYPLLDPADLSRCEHRVRCDSLGYFRLTGLSMRLPEDIALVVRRDGSGDIVVHPLERSAGGSLELVMPHPSLLELDVGYQRPPETDDHRFLLEYLGPEEGTAPRQLGELMSPGYGMDRFVPVRPGRYRVTWGLRDAYEHLPPLAEEVTVPEGGGARLALRLDGRRVPGRAWLNGVPLARGWVLLTVDPALPDSTRVGRVVDGVFELVDPPTTLRAWAAVIPESRSVPRQNPARGEAVPVEVRGYAQGARGGGIDVSYRGHDVTLRFTPAFLERHPGANLAYRGQAWDRGRFRPIDRQEAIPGPRVRFRLLAPGTHRFAVRSPRDSLIAARVVNLDGDDLTLDFR